MFTPLAVFSVSSLCTAFVFARRAWALRALIQPLAQSQHIKSEHEQLFIPVIGAKESGKTLIIAHFGSHLSSFVSGEFTGRLLTQLEEENARGRRLKAFDPQASSLPLPARGERTSRALILMELAQFEQKQLQSSTEAPPQKHTQDQAEEEALLWLQFAAKGPLAGQRLLLLCDVPSEQFIDERSHSANIEPKLRRADALILVLDGPALLAHEANEHPQSIRYQQVLENYLARGRGGPVWILITKADLLPETHQDEAWWHTYVLRQIAPLLQLRDSGSSFEITLVSALPTHDQGYARLKSTAEKLCLSLRTVLEHRHKNRKNTHKKRQSTLWITLVFCLFGGIFAWSATGALLVEGLPPTRGERTWDLASLEIASAPRLELIQASKKLIHPSWLFRERLSVELNTLRHAYWTLVRSQADTWAISLRTAPQSEVDSRAQLLHQTLDRSRSFNEVRSVDEPWRPEERALAERIELALTDISTLKTLQDINEMNILRRAWDGRCEVVLKLHAEGRHSPFECALKDWIVNSLSSSRETQLDEAGLRPVLASADPTELSSRLSPLLRWEANNADLLASDPLIARLMRYKSEAWEASWDHVKRLLEEPTSTGEIASRLKLLQRFEQDRVTLNARFPVILEMPPGIALAWRDRLNLESTRFKHEEARLPASKQQEIEGLVEWAAPYLDPKRRAKVRLLSREERWKRVLTHAFKRSTSDYFEDALRQINKDLDELEGEEGHDEIQRDLGIWRVRLEELRAWSSPPQVPLSASEIRCDEAALEAEGLDQSEDESTWRAKWYVPLPRGDYRDYYLVLALDVSIPPVSSSDTPAEATSLPSTSQHVPPKEQAVETPKEQAASSQSTPRVVILSEAVELDDEVMIAWKPWSKIKLKLYERDGKLDKVPGEGDDDLISDMSVWSVGSEHPSATLKLTPQGSCEIDLTLHHALSEWVYELGLISRPPQKPAP